MKRLIRLETKHNPQIDDRFHQFNSGNIGNVIYWLEIFKLIKNISGDIVECGIGRGRSLIVLSALNQIFEKAEGGERSIYAYDSFEGFPMPSEQDKSPRKPQKGDWAFSPSGKYKYTPEFVREILQDANIKVVDSNISIIKGFFSDSLNFHPDRPIALLHIDGDLYQSYKDALEKLYERVQVGGVIVFDDFLEGADENEKWPGARLAVKDFLGIRYDELIASPRGNYYFIK
jgi:hypothetical protein